MLVVRQWPLSSHVTALHESIDPVIIQQQDMLLHRTVKPQTVSSKQTVRETRPTIVHILNVVQLNLFAI